MGRRVVLVLCILAALVFTSGAVGGGGAKFKVAMDGYSLMCSNVPGCDFGTVLITRLDDDRTVCHLQGGIGTHGCTWTAPAGTKMVLEITAAMPDGTFVWSDDCTNTGPRCKLVVDSNKSIFITAAWTGP
jgi:hypothetical protein